MSKYRIKRFSLGSKGFMKKFLKETINESQSGGGSSLVKLPTMPAMIGSIQGPGPVLGLAAHKILKK